METGQRLKIIRATLGLKQEEMAEALGIKQGSYSAIESGRSSISQKIKERLIYNLKVSPLFLDNGIPPPLLSDQGTVKDRVAHLMTHFQMNLGVFCRTLGLNDTATAKFTVMMSERNDPPDETLQMICERFPDVSYDWLKFGRGAMFVSGGTSTQQNYSSLPARVQEMVMENAKLKEEVKGMKMILEGKDQQIELLRGLLQKEGVAD